MAPPRRRRQPGGAPPADTDDYWREEAESASGFRRRAARACATLARAWLLGLAVAFVASVARGGRADTFLVWV